MGDPEYLNAALRELARLRHELSDLTNPKKPPLGRTEFVQRYIADLKQRIALLEAELKDA